MTRGEHTVSVSADELQINVTAAEVDEKLETLYPKEVAGYLGIELEDGEDPTENRQLREFVAERIGRRRLLNAIDGYIGKFKVNANMATHGGDPA